MSFAPSPPWPRKCACGCSAPWWWRARKGSRPAGCPSSSASPLSFHLKELTHAGLVSQERQGRNLIYRASFATMNDLLAYLTENCCQGAACATSDAAVACQC